MLKQLYIVWHHWRPNSSESNILIRGLFEMVFFLHLLVIRYRKSVGVVIKCYLLILWPSSRTTVLVSFHNRHTLTQRYTQMKALSPRLKIKFKSLVPFGNQECFIMHNSFCCVEAVSWDKLLMQTRSKRKTNAEIKG